MSIPQATAMTRSFIVLGEADLPTDERAPHAVTPVCALRFPDEPYADCLEEQLGGTGDLVWELVKQSRMDHVRSILALVARSEVSISVFLHESTRLRYIGCIRWYEVYRRAMLPWLAPHNDVRAELSAGFEEKSCGDGRCHSVKVGGSACRLGRGGYTSLVDAHLRTGDMTLFIEHSLSVLSRIRIIEGPPGRYPHLRSLMDFIGAAVRYWESGGHGSVAKDEVYETLAALGDKRMIVSSDFRIQGKQVSVTPNLVGPEDGLSPEEELSLI